MIKKLRSKGVAIHTMAILHTTMHEPEISLMDLGGAVRNERGRVELCH